MREGVPGPDLRPAVECVVHGLRAPVPDLPQRPVLPVVRVGVLPVDADAHVPAGLPLPLLRLGPDPEVRVLRGALQRVPDRLGLPELPGGLPQQHLLPGRLWQWLLLGSRLPRLPDLLALVPDLPVQGRLLHHLSRWHSVSPAYLCTVLPGNLLCRNWGLSGLHVSLLAVC